MGQNLSKPDRLYFESFEICPATRQLNCNGTAVPIGARAFDLLHCLVECRDRVVSRDEIMAKVWNGIVVGDNNLNVQVSLLRKLLGPQAVVTVPGHGLRFGYDVETGTPGSYPITLALPGKPSVVVLPFTDFGIEQSFAWLPDCIVEDITTELSRFRSLFVVARNSAFSYRDQPDDPHRVARDLGVRYVVKGSVRTASDRVRVAAQLIDTTSGRHVWAENFDNRLDSQLDVQNQISRAVVTALVPQIDAAENKRIRIAQTGDLDAHGVAQKGWSIISAGDMTYDPTPRDQARKLAEQALAMDPHSGLASRTLAWVHWWHAYHGTTKSFADTLEQGRKAADHALMVDDSDHHAWRLRALLDFMGRKPEAGLAELRRAHDINPNCAITLAWLGFYEATYGDPDKGIAEIRNALRLSPRDPSRGSMLAALGFAQFVARDYLAAANAAESALLAASGSATPLVLGSISWVGAGQLDKAKALFRQLRETAPRLAEARLSGLWLSDHEDYITRAHTFLQIAAGMVDPERAEPLR